MISRTSKLNDLMKKFSRALSNIKRGNISQRNIRIRNETKNERIENDLIRFAKSNLSNLTSVTL